MKTYNEIINAFEGNNVGKLIWPFYRYSALIPEQITGDLFIWLYLSLISYENQNQGLARNNYSEAVKLNVEKILQDKFSEIIDKQTLEKIENNAETEFIEGNRIKNDAFSYIDTLESLFSDKLDMMYIYQDGITGEVLPFFGDTSGIKSVKNVKNSEETEDAKDTEDMEYAEEAEDAEDTDKTEKEIKIDIRKAVREPSAKAVRDAYRQYIKIKKHNDPDIDQDIEIENEYIDKNEKTLSENGVEEASFSAEKEDKESLNNYNIIFLKDKQVTFNLEVPIYIKDNELAAHSPFGKNTNQWIDRCMKKGRNVSPELEKQLAELEKKYVIEERKIEEFIENCRDDFAASLTAADALPELYREIKKLNDHIFIKYVIYMDYDIRRKRYTFYNDCGNFMERLVNKASYNKNNQRDLDFISYCKEINNKCKDKNVLNSLSNQDIFNKWQRNNDSFKAKVADIILRTNLTEDHPGLIKDMLDLYTMRNIYGSHDHDYKVEIQTECVNTLLKITRIFFEANLIRNKEIRNYGKK